MEMRGVVTLHTQEALKVIESFSGVLSVLANLIVL